MSRYSPNFRNDGEAWRSLIETCREIGVYEAINILNDTYSEIAGEEIKRTESSGNLSLSSKSYRIKSIEDLIEVCEIDLEKYEIKKHTINKWEVASKIEDKLITKELYQVKAELIKKQDNAIDIVKSIENNICKSIKKLNTDIKLKKISKKADKLLEPFITDLHIGKLSFNKSGDIIYNKKKAIKLYENIIEDIVSRIDLERIERILLPVGNDLINIDNQGNTTFKGTPQLTGDLFENLVRDTELLLIKVIDKLKKIAPVDVMCIPGNHDLQTIYHLGRTIWGYYANDDNVNILNSVNSRKYYNFYDVMLGFAHGHNLKINQIAEIAATENSLMWGNTKYREFHLGHFHHLNTKSNLIQYQEGIRKRGITVRLCPTVCPADRWHNEKGYVDTDNKSCTFVFSRDNLDQILFTNF